jgi:hypothetical protein
MSLGRGEGRSEWGCGQGSVEWKERRAGLSERRAGLSVKGEGVA